MTQSALGALVWDGPAQAMSTEAALGIGQETNHPIYLGAPERQRLATAAVKTAIGSQMHEAINGDEDNGDSE